MVVRKQKKNRKYLGTRRWGVGNIKNARGAGDRGGVGGVGRLTKHDFTYITAKAPWMLRKKGFAPWKRKSMKEVTLERISKMEGSEVNLKGYKVLSNGSLGRPVTIKASGFSKGAIEKIREAGGKALLQDGSEAKVKE